MGSTLLFADPSLLTGASRSLDLGATFDDYNESSTPEQADERALRHDWYIVGDALYAAICEFVAANSADEGSASGGEK